MKANEAPEKIILSADRDTQIINDEWVINDYTDNIKIEYTRTDAFIEKAVSYLEGTLFNEVCYGEIRPDIVQTYINDFKKAMEK